MLPHIIKDMVINMENNIIIKSERYNVKIIHLYALIFGCFIFAVIFFALTLQNFYDLSEWFLAFDFWEALFLNSFLGVTFYSFVIPQIVAAIIYLWLKKYELTVTDSHIYGTGAFGKRVNISIDSITNVRIGGFKSIVITTEFSKNSFIYIKNRNDIYLVLCDLVKDNPKSNANVDFSESHDKDVQSNEYHIELLKHILLLLFTCGVWNFIWIYKTTKYLNNYKITEYRDPTKKLLLCIFVPFYSIYWTYKSAQIIDGYANKIGMESDLSTLCLILAIFIGIIPPILMQDKINAIIKGVPTKAIIDSADELKKYKDLLDSGVITQDEFDQKKKQLLGL